MRYNKGMENREWLQGITEDSQGEIADKIGISRRTLQNQIYGELKAETVINIADAYEINPILALYDLGFIASHWMAEIQSNRRMQLASLTEEELRDEVFRRMIRGLESDALTAEVTEVDFTRARKEIMEELEEEPERYVAKRKRQEPSEGDDDYGSGA